MCQRLDCCPDCGESAPACVCGDADEAFVAVSARLRRLRRGEERPEEIGGWPGNESCVES